MERKPVMTARLGVVLAAFAIALGATPQPAQALEAKADLNVQLRLVETIPAAAKTGSSANGVARIDVLVDAFRLTNGIRLAIEKPDGTAWTFRSRPVTANNLTWTGPGGEPLEPDAEGPSVPARGAIRTSIAVPLEGAAIHEIIVKVLGTVGGEPIGTEGAIRVTFGVPDPITIDEDGVANFTMKEVK